MYLLNFVLGLVISSVINGHEQKHWIEDGGVCHRDYGPDDHCIHYTNCLSGKYGESKKGRTEFCRFSGMHPTLCCVDVDDDFPEEDCSEEVYTFSVDPNDDYSHHHQHHHQQHAYGGDGSTKPWEKPDQISTKPPPHSWDRHKESNYPQHPHGEDKSTKPPHYYNNHEPHYPYGEDKSTKPPPYHNNHDQHHSYGEDKSTKPPPYHYNHEQHAGGKPPTYGWDWHKETNYPQHSYGGDESTKPPHYHDNHEQHIGSKPPPYSWDKHKESNYPQHPYGGVESPKPPPYHHNHEQHVGSRPPTHGWDCHNETNYGGSNYYPHQNVPKPQPPKQESDQNFKPTTINPQQPTTISSISVTATTTTSTTTPQVTEDNQDRQNAPQSPETAGTPAPGANNENNITVTLRPFYRPTLQNSTSLQKCREYFTPLPLKKGPHTPILGGRPATPGQFPHLALLGYGDADNIQWSCGGTLISEQFVLTAAHCLGHRIFGPVQVVRLGELDLTTTAEESDVRDFTVIQRIRHPMYRLGSSYYDIALLRLNASIPTFNKYIKPACLPNTLELDGRVLIAAGWGLLEEGGVMATILQRVSLSHVPNARCRNIYGTPRNIRNGIVEALQVCADGGKERRDACQGDSGGPLQLTNYDYFNEFTTGFVEVVGVTSFGKACGLTAGVYTRVLPFVDWIEKIVWPNN